MERHRLTRSGRAGSVAAVRLAVAAVRLAVAAVRLAVAAVRPAVAAVRPAQKSRREQSRQVSSTSTTPTTAPMP
ncbi:hypothetical protein GA0070214_102359 [Micromonospora chaiyaphumensis]|uniref:Uncharacterized protein n=1 Tax=Micromonospora chaiyaphumensis TaxID=307119 RepID=A0A1C4VGP6_9ACTN|nr:hypothetical protein GA0070214_102359 [Micromonospora chaiyaphumensis]